MIQCGKEKRAKFVLCIHTMHYISLFSFPQFHRLEIKNIPHGPVWGKNKTKNKTKTNKQTYRWSESGKNKIHPYFLTFLCKTLIFLSLMSSISLSSMASVDLLLLSVFMVDSSASFLVIVASFSSILARRASTCTTFKTRWCYYVVLLCSTGHIHIESMRSIFNFKILWHIFYPHMNTRLGRGATEFCLKYLGQKGPKQLESYYHTVLSLINAPPLINAPLTYFQIKLGKMPKFLYGVSL